MGNYPYWTIWFCCVLLIVLTFKDEINSFVFGLLMIDFWILFTANEIAYYKEREREMKEE